MKEEIELIKRMASPGSKPGLERLQVLLKKMGNPEGKLKFIHIAGTNGKGSTCAMISEMLKSAGYRVGMFTSPYLDRMTEQIKVNGKEISEDALLSIIDEIKTIIDTLNEEDIPTEFEIITAIAFSYFDLERCDIVVLEAGLGGSFDATNVIMNTELAVITNIGKDHINYLGDTLTSIAEHKAGIIKPNCTVVSYEQEKEVTKVLKNKAKKENVEIIFADFSKIILDRENISGQYFSYKEFEQLYLPLLGEHQRKNSVLAIEAMLALKERGYKFSKVAVYRGLRQVNWPARFECLHKEPYVFLDGGHNVQGIKELVKLFHTYFKDKRFIFVTGVMADKDYQGMYQLLSPFANEFIAVEPKNDRALSAEILSGLLKNYSNQVYVANSITEGIQLSLAHANKDDIIIAIGSLYMAGEVRGYFMKEKC